LLSFKEYSFQFSNLAPAFPGVKHHLLNRVTRIVYNKNRATSTAQKLFFAVGCIAIVLFSYTSTNNITRGTVHPTFTNNTIASYFQKANKEEAIVQEIFLPQNSSEEQTVLSNKKITTEQPYISDKSTEMPFAEEEVPEEKASEEIAKEWAETDALAALKNKQQAEEAQLQAIKAKDEAMLNHMQVMEDLKQAEADRIQAEQERLTADRERDARPLPEPMEESIYKQQQLKKEMEKRLNNALQNRK